MVFPFNWLVSLLSQYSVATANTDNEVLQLRDLQRKVWYRRRGNREISRRISHWNQPTFDEKCHSKSTRKVWKAAENDRSEFSIPSRFSTNVFKVLYHRLGWQDFSKSQEWIASRTDSYLVTLLPNSNGFLGKAKHQNVF